MENKLTTKKRWEGGKVGLKINLKKPKMITVRGKQV
jgi:hypothetical protein